MYPLLVWLHSLVHVGSFLNSNHYHIHTVHAQARVSSTFCWPCYKALTKTGRPTQSQMIESLALQELAKIIRKRVKNNSK